MARSSQLAPLLITTALMFGGCGSNMPLTSIKAPDLSGFTFFDLIKPRGNALRGPKNLPPVDYPGDIWVDRKGCVFVRTGGREWLPQVDNERRPICDRANAGQVIKDGQTASVDTSPRIFVDDATGYRTEVLAPVTIRESYVQVGTFADKSNLQKVRVGFSKLGFPIADPTKTPRSDRATSVILGPFTVQSALDDALSVVKEKGYKDAFVFTF